MFKNPFNLAGYHQETGDFAIGLDRTVLGFTFGISVLTGLIFGLAPALQVAGTHLSDTLKENGRGSTGSSASRRLRSALVVSEVAFALLLLVGAGLMIKSFTRLLDVNPGFRTAHVLSMRLSLPQSSYADGPHINAFYREVLDRIRSLPGVEAAGAVSSLPMGGVYSGTGACRGGHWIRTRVRFCADSLNGKYAVWRQRARSGNVSCCGGFSRSSRDRGELDSRPQGHAG